eukprot:TRINITY_DN463_c0_g2_i28.p1 TRINITY_DN463_c0_g2~~TRINITY_DN463_c0_g2_i28.p1  ORF type:complete len:167 (+),score=6.65 TRINITY_DN463_c0_g2_i28:236-736(+)
MLFLGNNTSSHAHYLFPLTLVCFHLYLLRLDDLREFRSKIPIPVYLDKETYQDLSRVFPYLVDVSKVGLRLGLVSGWFGLYLYCIQATSSGFVSSLAWNIIDTGTPFVVFGNVKFYSSHDWNQFCCIADISSQSKSSKSSHTLPALRRKIPHQLTLSKDYVSPHFQ